jgi:hypothetical protein
MRADVSISAKDVNSYTSDVMEFACLTPIAGHRSSVVMELIGHWTTGASIVLRLPAWHP